jgi:two-component system CheB/CheR fusion protein
MTPRDPAASGPHLPIDQFLRSLAQDCGSRAIGVILSGAGADGASGLEAVKVAGGVTLAQDPATARFSSMPQAAIGRGCVDFVLSPEAIAAELATLGHQLYLTEREAPELLVRVESGRFGPILEFLRAATGIDFSHYPENMIQRRIVPRLALRNLDSLEEYRKLIESNPVESSALNRDLLISMACSFRDLKSFDSLKTLVYPRLLHKRPAHAPIRVWVPGCATGEVAFSIAITLSEYLTVTGESFPVQIFGSDPSEQAIGRARGGRYAENISSDISAERLDRCFTRIEGQYRINNDLREMCTFARHNLLADPPFSKLDLLTCRNLHIDLAGVQNIIPLFHYVEVRLIFDFVVLGCGAVPLFFF